MYNSDQPTPSFHISNRGTGPAIIKYAKVKPGANVIRYWTDTMGFPSSTTQSHVGGMTLPSHESIPAIAIYKSANDEQVSEFKNSLQSLSIELCYCSIYDECWLIDKANKTSPVLKCEINEEERFLQ